MKTIYLLLILNLVSLSIDAQETFTPYSSPAEVPKTATELWQDYDAQKESLDIQVIKEWKAEGVVTQYVTFKVGTFKGTEARIAAYYSYPDNGKRNAAFVWSHGRLVVFPLHHRVVCGIAPRNVCSSLRFIARP